MFPKNFLTNANISMASLKTKCSIKKDLHCGGKWASTEQSVEAHSQSLAEDAFSLNLETRQECLSSQVLFKTKRP